MASQHASLAISYRLLSHTIPKQQEHNKNVRDNYSYELQYW